MLTVSRGGNIMGFWKGLLIFTLGVTTGVGAIGITGYAVANSFTVRDAQNLTGIDMTKIVNEDYYDESIISFINLYRSGELDFSTLGGIAKVTPIVDEIYNQINDVLDRQLGVILNKEELYAKKFNELGDYFIEYVKDNISVPFILNVDENSDIILQYICYHLDENGKPDYSNPRSVSDLGNPNLIDEIKNAIVLGDVMQISEDDKLLWNLRDKKLTEISQDTFMDMVLGDILDIPDDNKILNAIKDKTLRELTDAHTFNGLYLRDILDYDENDKFLSKLGGYTLLEIESKGQELFKEFTLSDIMDIDEDSPLYDIRNTPIDNLKEKDTYSDVKLGSIVEIDENSSQILQTLKDTEIGKISDKINELTLGEVIDCTGSKILNALADTKIDEIGDKIDSLTLEEMIDIDPSNKILYALRDYTMNDIGDGVKTLKLSDVIDIDEDSPLILRNLEDETIDGLSDAIDNLKIEDAIDINDDSSQFLKALKGTKINDLADRIDTLTVGEVIDTTGGNRILAYLSDKKIVELGDAIDNLTIDDTIDINDDSSQFLKALTGIKLKDLADKINSLTIGEAFKDQIYEDPDNEATMKATWVYLLRDKDTGVIRTDYKVASDMDKLVENMKYNVQHATLFALKRDGFIEADDDFLETEIVYGGTLRKVGDLTIDQFIQYAQSLMSATPSISI